MRKNRHGVVLLSLLSTFILSSCSLMPTPVDPSEFEHNYSSKWTYDENTHWHACIDKGFEDLKSDEETHQMRESVALNGEITHYCYVCGYTYKTTDYDPNNSVEIDFVYTIYNPRNLNEQLNHYTRNAEFLGDISQSRKYNIGSIAPLHAYPATGYTFIGWYADSTTCLSTSGDYNYSVGNESIQIEVRFKYTEYQLYAYVNNSNSGYISTDGGMSCYENVTLSCYYTERVTLYSVTTGSNRFLGWYSGNGVLLSSNGNYSFQMNNYNLNIEARWDTSQFTLSVSSSDWTMGSVYIDQGSGIPGETVTVRAVPNEGYIFTGWYMENEKVGYYPTMTFTMPSRDVYLTAYFDSESVVPESLWIDDIQEFLGIEFTYLTDQGMYLYNEELPSEDYDEETIRQFARDIANDLSARDLTITISEINYGNYVFLVLFSDYGYMQLYGYALQSSDGQYHFGIEMCVYLFNDTTLPPYVKAISALMQLELQQHPDVDHCFYYQGISNYAWVVDQGAGDLDTYGQTIIQYYSEVADVVNSFLGFTISSANTISDGHLCVVLTNSENWTIVVVFLVEDGLWTGEIYVEATYSENPEG